MTRYSDIPLSLTVINPTEGPLMIAGTIIIPAGGAFPVKLGGLSEHRRLDLYLALLRACEGGLLRMIIDKTSAPAEIEQAEPPAAIGA